jgi:hypothetical protein
MRESRQSKAAERAGVEQLLHRLRDLSQFDPPPALRERLGELCSLRLTERSSGRRATRLRWFRPAFAAALLIAVALTAGLLIHRWSVPRLRSGDQRLHEKDPRLHSGHDLPPNLLSAGSPLRSVPGRVTTKATPAGRLKSRRSPPVPNSDPPRMVLSLPYSNSEITAGTGVTIRVSMSQSELMSLGLPVSAMVADRHVVADLILGDDGLPRAISLPLPLEYLKEKK